MTDAEIIRAAEARANRECARGLDELRALAATTPEWIRTTHQGHLSTSLIPARAHVQGILEHIEEVQRRAGSVGGPSADA